ncbi:hypothetical protein [Ornithinibacillus californiensis]|uniref:hypothetical protein n=1 Tax=Ornithinibacillus californiensis TaxID=161536 RepID=UPI00064D9CA6|nr:hypothetical protein [Ornithinibacillus californiensis]
MKNQFLFIAVFIVLITVLVGCSNDEQVEASKSGLDSMRQNYEDRGKECKLINDVVERGDCFQEVNELYLKWNSNLMEDFQYSPLTDGLRWEEVKNIFYFSIDENSELSEVQITEDYEVYLQENSQQNTQLQEEIVKEYWYIFSNLIPKEYRKDLKQLVWTNLPGYYYFVGRDEENIEHTTLNFAVKTPKYDPNYHKGILIHEFGHILTSNKDQVKVESDFHLSDDVEVIAQAIEECPTFYLFGCANEDSYLYQFYLEFWEDMMGDYEAIDWSIEDDYRTFYQKYEDRFFNGYQAWDPNEDFAETFTFFIMLNSEELQGQSDMKYEKIKFLYGYDELVQLRTQILENLYDLSVKDKKFY